MDDDALQNELSDADDLSDDLEDALTPDKVEAGMERVGSHHG
jgi:hypothetical protein